MNKIILVTALIGLIDCCELVAQPDPIQITFVEAQPLWEHLVWDTSFYEIGNQPDINKYNVVKPHQSFRFSNDLFLSHYCTNHRAELYGYILERLNIHTGVVQWQNYSTYYNGGLQDHYKNLFIRPDGNIEMVGIKRHGPYLNSGFAYWNTGGGKSNFVRKIFNYQTGKLEHTKIGFDSIDYIIPSYLNHFPIEIDSVYLVSELTGRQMNGTIAYGFDFYLLDHQHNLIDTLPVSTILYETSDSINFFSYGQPQYLEYLDDTTMVALIFQDWGELGKTRAQLMWLNVKDVHDIKVIRRLNIESLIPGYFQNLLYFRFEVENGLIYISQPYPDETIGQYVSYLICLDGNGNLMHNISKCEVNGHNYESLHLMYSTLEFDYFAAFGSISGREGFDILKLNRGLNEFELVGSLTSAIEGEEFTRQMEVCKVYQDGIVIIGAYTKKEGIVENSAVKYYAFRAEDLGMDLTTSQEDPNSNAAFLVYPNPTDGPVEIKFERVVSGRITILNQSGFQLAIYPIKSLDRYKLNLNDFSAGLYFAMIEDDNTGQTHTVKIIKTTNIR